jgi:phospholipid/cholesterol/gamma-HCH transport system substrate-binding protein
VNYIQISAGTLTMPLLKDTVPASAVPVIRTKEGALESLLQGGGDVLTRTVEALDRINQLLSNQNIASVSATLKDVRAIADEVKSQKQILGDLDQTIKSLDQTSQHIQQLADSSNQLLNGEGKRTLQNLAEAADQIKGVAQDARSTLGAVKGPAADFAVNGLPRISAAVVSLQSAAETLNRVLNDIEQNPRGVLNKPPAVEMKVRP